MTTEQINNETMFLAVGNYSILNEAVMKNILKFASSAAILKKKTEEIKSTALIQGTNKTGLAMDKGRLRKKLIELTLRNANKATILARQNNNDTLLKEVRLKESDLGRLPAVTLVERAQLIYDRVEANIANLTEQGITPDTQKVFQETINTFNNVIAAPRIGIGERRQATQKLLLLFREAGAELEIMDLAARSAKEEYPDFYNGYVNARKIIETGARSLALKATAKELSSGVPLGGAVFVFKNEKGSNGNGEIVKKTSEKGNFHLKSMEPGTYKVAVSKEGYRGTEVIINVTNGERSELVVELEKD